MAQVTLDAIDRRILDNLQRNGRLTNLELADRVGLSPSPCLRRVRALEEAGIIEGYAAVLNRKKLGLGMTVFILMKREWQSDAEAAAFREQVTAMPEVVACHTTSGEHDFMIQAVVADLEAYRRFALERLMRMSGVKDIRSSFAIETVKENGPLPLRHLG